MRVLLKTEKTSREPSFILGVATTADEVESVQKLRYDVFSTELGVKFDTVGIDKDYFDSFCEHLMVIDDSKNQVVGTYRILSPQKAVEAGRYYSESEFDISGLNDIRPLLAECGRACTHLNYRSGPVLMLLWAGLTYYMKSYNHRFMLGCASVSLSDGGKQAAEVWNYAREEMKKHPERAQLKPIIPYPLEKLESLINDSNAAKFHSLIKGYIKVGAYICGKPSFDEHFNSCDFPIIIDSSTMDLRSYKLFEEFTNKVVT